MKERGTVRPVPGVAFLHAIAHIIGRSKRATTSSPIPIITASDESDRWLLIVIQLLMSVRVEDATAYKNAERSRGDQGVNRTIHTICLYPYEAKQSE